MSAALVCLSSPVITLIKPLSVESFFFSLLAVTLLEQARFQQYNTTCISAPCVREVAAPIEGNYQDFRL
jgi:hypothetical protein